jgi:hypothetical protein
MPNPTIPAAVSLVATLKAAAASIAPADDAELFDLNRT